MLHMYVYYMYMYMHNTFDMYYTLLYIPYMYMYINMRVHVRYMHVYVHYYHIARGQTCCTNWKWLDLRLPLLSAKKVREEWAGLCCHGYGCFVGSEGHGLLYGTSDGRLGLVKILQ